MINIPVPVAVSTSAVAITPVPSGAATVILSNTGTNTAYIGTTANVTSSNGFPLPTGATITIPSYTSAKSVTLYAICASAQSATVGAIISGPF